MRKLITRWYFLTTDSCLIFSKWISFSISCICWSLYKWALFIFIKWIKNHFTLHFGWCVDSNVDIFVGKFLGNYYFFALVLLTNSLADCFDFCAGWCLAWLFVKIRFSFDLHIYLMPKNHFIHSNQPKTGIFFKGLFGPRSKPSPLEICPPCFKCKPFPTMPGLEPQKGSKYSPRPAQLSNVWAFFQIQPISRRPVCRFFRQSQPNTWQCPSRQCWENGLC